MEIYVNQLLRMIISIQWLELVKAMAPVVTAIIAFKALRNWQRQDRAKREVEFLDQLIDATHSHIIEMRIPVEILRGTQIGMQSQVRTERNGDLGPITAQGAIAYVNKRGTEDGKRLSEALASAEQSVVRLKSLALKGFMFSFENYSECYNSIQILTWSHERLQGYVVTIISPTWNWENPQVRSLLDKVILIDPKDISQDLHKNNTEIIKFCRETYSRIYG